MDRLLSMAVFVSAVEEGSLVSAARRFGLSPSMAGKHVSAIEEQLKVRLLQQHAQVDANGCRKVLLHAMQALAGRI